MNYTRLLLVVSFLACFAGCNAQAPSSSFTTASTVSAARTAPGGQIQSYADIVAKVAPAVVTVRSERRVRAPEMFPFFDQFGDLFGVPDERQMPQRRQPRSQVQRGLGSGVIIRADGHCLTNHHVVDGAQEIRVELSDGRQMEAKLVGSDPASDLALLKINANNLPVLSLGDSNAVRVGDVVLAIGNPLGVGQTVTLGIISAKNRTTGVGEGSFEDFLQTDAPINQGNSGGALINTAGELIGINSQIVSMSGGNIGIGFAIPSNMARNVAEQLGKSGRVRRGQLGVGIQPLNPEIASSMGIPNTRGVLINSVTPGSPADRGGLRRGDVITGLNGQPVTDLNMLRNQIAAAGPGSEVTLTIMREGKESQVRTSLGELSADGSNRPGAPGAPDRPRGGRLGVSAEPVTAETAGRLGLRTNEGLLIRDVDPDGAAAEAGLTAGDVIVEADRQPMRSIADLEAVLAKAGNRPVLLLMNRRGQTFYLTVRPKTGQ